MLAWEPIVQESNGRWTDRLNVPGGWIVRTVDASKCPASIAQTFVADEDHTWNPHT